MQITREMLKIKKYCGVNNKSVLFIVDMNNGFAKEGALYSDRVEGIIPRVVKVTDMFVKNNMPVFAFTDRHKENSPEFNAFPIHCLEGTDETEIIDELKAFGESVKTIPKQSTNAFLEACTQQELEKLIEDDVKEFIIVGCCTDLCVKQFALSLKTYFNMLNLKKDVSVVVNAVETYDAPQHEADFMNNITFMDMQLNDINLIEI